MTALRQRNKPLWKETAYAVRDRGKIRPVCVALEPASLLLRPKGTRQTLRLPYGVAFAQAARAEADRLTEQRRTAAGGDRKVSRRQVRRGQL